MNPRGAIIVTKKPSKTEAEKSQSAGFGDRCGRGDGDSSNPSEPGAAHKTCYSRSGHRKQVTGAEIGFAEREHASAQVREPTAFLIDGAGGDDGCDEQRAEMNRLQAQRKVIRRTHRVVHQSVVGVEPDRVPSRDVELDEECARPIRFVDAEQSARRCVSAPPHHKVLRRSRTRYPRWTRLIPKEARRIPKSHRRSVDERFLKARRPVEVIAVEVIAREDSVPGDRQCQVCADEVFQVFRFCPRHVPEEMTSSGSYDPWREYQRLREGRPSTFERNSGETVFTCDGPSGSA